MSKFSRSFMEIKEQIESYPELLTTNEEAIEIAFQEGRITEAERLELLILLLEIGYRKLQHIDRFHDDSREVLYVISKLEEKVMKFFPDFDLLNGRMYFPRIVRTYLKLKQQNSRIKLEHIIVLYSYTHDLFAGGYIFERINTELREQRPTEYTSRITKLLDEALDFLPSYQGIVYRAVRRLDWSQFRAQNEAGKLQEQYRPGLVFREKAFLSTSRNPEEFNSLIKFQIISKNGKDIEEFSLPSEKEVLFKAGTKFKVLKLVTDKWKWHFLIYLEEVS